MTVENCTYHKITFSIPSLSTCLKREALKLQTLHFKDTSNVSDNKAAKREYFK